MKRLIGLARWGWHVPADQIARYLDGTLPPRDHEAVQHHLRECPRCAGLGEDQRLARRSIHALALDRAVPAGVDARLRDRLAAAVTPFPLTPSTALPSRPLESVHLAPVHRVPNHTGTPGALRHAPLTLVTRAPLPRPRASISGSASGSALPRGRLSAFPAVAAVLLLAVGSFALFGLMGARTARPTGGSATVGAAPATSAACAPAGATTAADAWHVSDPALLTLNAIAMAAPSAGWAVGEYAGQFGIIERYAGGQWTLSGVVPEARLLGVAVADGGAAWAVGASCAGPRPGLILHIAADGNWSQVLTPAEGVLRAVLPLALGDALAAGDGVILEEHAGHWTPIAGALAASARITGLAVAPSGDVWAVGASGRVLRASGGAWRQASVTRDSVREVDLEAIAMEAPDDGWAVGGYGGGDGGVGDRTALFHYSGGAWMVDHEPLAAVTMGALFGVAMVSPDDGWAVGGTSQSLILRYHAGLWAPLTKIWPDGLRAIAMISPREGWAVGQEGLILHERDGVWVDAYANPTP